MKHPIKTKGRIVVTGNRPDTYPSHRKMREAAIHLEDLKRQGYACWSMERRVALRRLAKAQINHALICGRAMACKLVWTEVPYKRPARHNERQAAIREQLEAVSCR